jgi:hypothetical protein
MDHREFGKTGLKVSSNGRVRRGIGGTREG